MENAQFQPEFLPLQGGAYERLKEPGDARTFGRAAAPPLSSSPLPRDHVVWSLFNLVYMNPFCLGLAALYFSIKARDRKVTGDLEGAREYGSTARCLNIIALCLTLSLAVLLIFLLFMGVMTLY
ncbi:14 kDa transmembrane protein-like [Scleropages formosus]|uniref:14 kDa transmembrane protein-like n=1 Tax=Scleropages formosus TaxID=113540 RepID=A0A0P7UM55_SCLFO|nr:dispanin subfamily A member 2b-like [Scleropages formosus]KPP60674.1 14 kDa transmembrane protein-like [Scleropages formosus]